MKFDPAYSEIGHRTDNRPVYDLATIQAAILSAMEQLVEIDKILYPLSVDGDGEQDGIPGSKEGAEDLFEAREMVVGLIGLLDETQGSIDAIRGIIRQD